MKKICYILIVLMLLLSIGSCSTCGGDSTDNPSDEPLEEVAKYKVEFYVDDTLYETQTIEEGKKISKPTDPTKENAFFDGWYVDGEKWLFAAGIVSNDMKLEAKFNQVDPNLGIVPVYQGMEASNIGSAANRREKKDIEKEVIPSIDVIETEGVDFFTKKGEKYLVTVHLYNPASYEILSFTLDGKKYQSFEFKEGSNSTELIIEMVAPTVSGIKDLTIDAIKYVDGTDILDVRMEGDKTINVGVEYEFLPTCAKNQSEITTSSYTASFNITDESKLMNPENDLLVYLYDGQTIVERKHLTLGKNIVKFDNLEVGLEYQYMIVGIYDSLNSKGKSANVLYKETFNTLDAFTISDIDPLNKGVNFVVNTNPSSATLKTISLYLGDKLIKSSTEIVNNFNELLSNTTYTLKLEYEFLFDDEKISRVLEYDFTTLSLEKPVLKLNSSVADKNSITYSLIKTDVDNTIKSILVNLYLNEQLIESSKLENFSFTNLLSNNTYKLEIVYLYNLNEGKNDISEILEKEVTTVAKKAPTAEVITNVGSTNVTFELVLNDTEEIAHLKSIKLYQEEILISSLQDLTVREFVDLKSNVPYEIEVIYEYDLNDGLGVNELIVRKQIHTGKLTPTVEVTTGVKDTIVDFIVKVTDINSTGHIESISIYQNEKLVEKLTDLSLRRFEGLLSNTEYDVVVVYQYDLDDGLGSREIVSSATCVTLKALPSVEIESKVTKTSISVTPIITDIDLAGALSKVELYLNNELKETLTSNYQFNELLSNTNYVIKVYYDYDLNNGKETLVKEFNVRTISLDEPSVDLKYTANKNSISYEVVYQDIDNIFKFEKVSLMKDGIVINTSDKLSGVFEGLNSNNTYKLVVNYTYNLNDGLADIKGVLEKEVTTVAKKAPTAEVITNVESNKVSFELVLNDIDEIAILKSIKLYQEEKLISSLQELSVREFTNLTSNVPYVIEVIYEYDLNDGLGINELKVTKDIQTGKLKPTVEITNEVTDKEIDFVVKVTDINSTGHIESISLYSKDKLVEKLTDLSLRRFENLTSNTEYKVVVVYQYDLDNGMGSQEFITELTCVTLKEIPVVEIEQKVTKDSILVTPNVTDKDSAGSLKKIELYLGNKLIEEKVENFNFTNLLSNTSYKVKVYYEYNLNNGLEELVEDFTITTNAKVAPIVDLTYTANKNNISYQVIYQDTDNIFTFESVSIVKDNITLSTSEELNGVFDTLYANNTYELVVNYKYDLNDGLGEISGVIKKSAKTSSLTKPSVGVVIDELTDSVVRGNLAKSDIDNILNIVDINLYQENNLVSTIYDEDFIFNIYSNIEYTIVINYNYDLADGNGIISDSFTYKFTSIKTTPRIIFTPYLISQNNIEYNLLISDNNVTGRVNMIALYQNGIFVKRLDETTSYIDGLESDKEYSIKVNYVYDFDDGYGSREINEEYFFNTLKVNPTYSLESNVVTKNSISIKHNITDIDGALSFNKVELYLGNKLIDTLDKIDSLTFNNLLSNTTYKVVALFDCDLNNGIGTITEAIEVKTFKMDTPSVNINLSSDKHSLTYDYEVIDNDKISTLKDIKLYLGDALIDVEAIDNKYINLYSNNEYRLVVTLVNDYHDGHVPVEEVYEKTIKTDSLADIDFNIMLSSDQESITYNYGLIDYDNISTIKEIQLYKGSTLVSTSNTLTSSFNDLLSNTTYRVVYVIEKDFNDNNEKVEVTYEQSVKTLAKEAPSVNLQFVSKAETIELDINSVDNDDVLNLIKIELYDGNLLINTYEHFEDIIFEDLESNTLYTFKLTYSYDLNDGLGENVMTIINDYSTLAYNVKLISYEILNPTQPKTNEDINIKLNLENLSNIKLDYLIIDGKKVNLSGGDLYNSAIFIIRSNSISGVQSIKVEQMGYHINGVDVVQNVDGLETINVNILSRLDIIDIHTVDASTLYKNKYIPGYIVTVDNPYGYTITSINEYDVQRIDDYHYLITSENSAITMITFDTITYINNEGEDCVRNFSQFIELDVQYIEPDSDTLAINIESISTPEQLFNMEYGHAYELACDIDLSGYQWEIKEFNGYFDGKGHKISNLTYIYETEAPGTSAAIFTELTGTFKNVYFENVYFNVEAQGKIYYGILTQRYYEGNAEISNVLISGNFNINANNSYGCGLMHNVKQISYVVDSFKVNDEMVSGYEVISKETFESETFQKETLGWNFTSKTYSEYNGYYYSIIDNAYIVIEKYIGTETDVIVPTTIDNLPVIGIADLAFENCETIESFEIKDNILFVGTSILKDCINLKKVKLYTNDLIIDYGYGYYPLVIDGLFNYSSNIRSQIEVIEIDYTSSEFNLCTDSSDMGDYISYNSLQTVKIPEGITKLSKPNHYNYVFDGSYIPYLSTVYLPKSLTNIGSDVFVAIDSLTNVYYEGTIEDWCNVEFEFFDSNPMYYAEHFYLRNDNGEWYEVTEIEIGNNVTKINDYQFYGFDNLVSVKISNGVTEIGEYAFVGCINLESVTFEGNNLRTIGSNSFAECSSLINITIPEGVTYIGDYAFRDCTSLANIELPSSLVSIGDGAFNGCTSLESVILPDGITSIGAFAFYNCTSLSDVEIPDSVTSIGACAFFGCTSLTNIELPSSLVSIGHTAFNDCSSLANIELPSSLVSIGEYAFSDCSSLENIELPSSLVSIGDYTFNGCTSLESVILPDGITSIGAFAFYNCTSLSDVEIPDSVTSIGVRAFSQCHNLESINLPSGLKEISYGLFDYSAINYIRIPDNVTKICQHSFSGSNGLIAYIPESVTIIESYAFTNVHSIYCGAEEQPKLWSNEWSDSGSVFWGVNRSDIAEIDDDYYLLDLENKTATLLLYRKNNEVVNILKTVEHKEETYVVTKIAEKAFSNLPIKSVTIPDTVISIGADAFYGCYNLETVTLETGSKLEKIGAYAFVNCNYLKTINLTAATNLKEIGVSAFENCYNLENFVIPVSVEVVADNCFNYCGDIVINCEVSSKPSGWSDDWNPSDCTVVWGYVKE